MIATSECRTKAQCPCTTLEQRRPFGVFRSTTIYTRLRLTAHQSQLLTNLTSQFEGVTLYSFNIQNMTVKLNANVKLLACHVMPEDKSDSEEDSYYRFLVDGKYVKYVTPVPGTFAGVELFARTCGPVLLSELLPPFPAGDWNKGYVDKDPETGEVAFFETETETLPGVQNVWHPVKLNEFDFVEQEELRSRVRISAHPELNDGKPVVIKTAVWPWEIADMEIETTAYEYIRGTGIGPRFHGHLTEEKEGRVVGIAIEWIQNARTAGPGDLESCKKALKRLHELGIKLGDVNKHNFLVREGAAGDASDVVLIDFEFAKKCSPQELEDEMSSLKESLEDTSFRGGVQILREG